MIHEELGRGAHGKVKKCTDLNDNASPYYVRGACARRGLEDGAHGRASPATAARRAHAALRRAARLPPPPQAMKIMRKRAEKLRFAERDNQQQSVQREIAILKKCSHPNIVRLIEVIDNQELEKVYLSTHWPRRGASAST